MASIVYAEVDITNPVRYVSERRRQLLCGDAWGLVAQFFGVPLSAPCAALRLSGKGGGPLCAALRIDVEHHRAASATLAVPGYGELNLHAGHAGRHSARLAVTTSRRSVPLGDTLRCNFLRVDDREPELRYLCVLNSDRNCVFRLRGTLVAGQRVLRDSVQRPPLVLPGRVRAVIEITAPVTPAGGSSAGVWNVRDPPAIGVPTTHVDGREWFCIGVFHHTDDDLPPDDTIRAAKRRR